MLRATRNLCLPEPRKRRKGRVTLKLSCLVHSLNLWYWPLSDLGPPQYGNSYLAQHEAVTQSELAKHWCHRLSLPSPTPQTRFPDLSARAELSPSLTGFHTEQVHVGCALHGKVPMDPKFQYAYDGKDFISFDNQTGTWVAAVQPAFPQKQRWETSKTWSQYVQWFLQHECLETLRSLLEQGRAALEQQGPNRNYGILPNADGTYYTQSSLEISPQQEDRHRYACRVEHGLWLPQEEGPSGRSPR
uniref:MHC class I-like antigen recognition-like domain-containing protein n=1 Tax=Pelusios castaneus TaxID=367368 RepID=A0A8C8VNY7_9SAUR